MLKTLFANFSILFASLCVGFLPVSAAELIGYGYKDDGTAAGAFLYSVDLATGIASPVGDLDRISTSSFRLQNLAIAPNGTGYGYKDDGGPAGGFLYSVNLEIGRASPVGDLDRISTSSFRLQNLVIAPNGVGYGYKDDGGPAGGFLYSVNLEIGRASPVGDLDRISTSSFRLRNLAIAPNGTGYGYKDDGSPAGAFLYSVNLATGIASPVGDLDRISTSSFRLQNLAIAPNGSGYGYRDDRSPAGGFLYSVDLKTGLASPVGDLDRISTSSFRLRNLTIAPNGMGYGYKDDGSPAGGFLYLVNLTTGLASPVGDLDRISTSSFRLQNLAIAPEQISLAAVNSVIPAIASPQVTANDDRADTTEGTMVSIDVLINDEGLDDSPISLVIESNPTGGSAIVGADNTVTYTPAVGFSGLDSFQYSVSDRNGESSNATVTVIVAMPPAVLALGTTSGQGAPANQESEISPATGADQGSSAGNAGAIGAFSVFLLLLAAALAIRRSGRSAGQNR